MKNGITILFLILLGNMYGCAQQNKMGKKLKKNGDAVFATYLDGIKTDNDAALVRNSLKDTIQSWLIKDLDYIHFLSTTKWIVDDAVFFNKGKDKALVFILFQPNDITWSRDYSKVIAGEKINGYWQFYYASLPLFVSERSGNNGNPISFEALAKDARFGLTSDGFILCDPKCRINYNYVDTDVWFPEWQREKHQLFLRNELPKNSFQDNRRMPH